LTAPADRKFSRWVRAYGVTRLARALNVSRQAVQGWIKSNPRFVPGLDSVKRIIAVSTEHPCGVGRLTLQDMALTIDATGARPIPIGAAKYIAETYGYDQVIIVARKVGDTGGEHCTTYGADKANCDVAASIGEFLKFKVMGWAQENTVVHAEPEEKPS
jgi:hypothetical protein